METLMLFIDGSVDVKLKTGYGACLVVSESAIYSESLKLEVQVKRFENTSSTKLELQTLIWALNRILLAGNELIIYTDSQNIIGLPGRREKLERNNFRSKNHELLSNHELYKLFFKLLDKVECSFVKVKGHQKSSQKNEIERVFTLVDRASRNALRKEAAKL